MAKKEINTYVGFIQSVKNYWMGFLNFTGVSSRSEYWYAWLFCLMLGVLALLVGGVVSSIVSALMFIPSRALAFRRFHDAGLSGWWYLTPCLVFCVWGAIRADMWLFYLNLDQMPLDLSVIAVIYLLWALMSLIVFVQPSKIKNNSYRK